MYIAVFTVKGTWSDPIPCPGEQKQNQVSYAILQLH